MAGRLLWIGTGSMAGRREVAMLRDTGHEVLHWSGGGLSASGSTLAPTALSALREARLATPSGELRALVCSQFRAVVVEESVILWGEYIRFFPGRVILRSYGQETRASDRLWECGVTQLMIQRRNLAYVPTMPVAGIEESWVSGLATDIVGSQVTSDDVHALRWGGPYDDSRPVVVMAHDTGAADYDRRHRAFVAEAFGTASLPTRVIDWEGSPDTPSWLDLLPAPLLQDLTSSAGLLATARSATSVQAFVLQAILTGTPVIYWAGSALAKAVGEGPGQAAGIAEAHAKLRRLAAGERDFVQALLRAQKPLAHRLEAARVRHAFMVAFPALIAAPEEPDESRLCVLQRAPESSNWQQVERLLACLLDPRTGSEEAATATIDTLFHIALQRDPGRDERRANLEAIKAGTGPLLIMRALLRSPEAQALRPRNRMQAWLNDVRATAATTG